MDCIIVAVWYLVRHLLHDHPVYGVLSLEDIGRWTCRDFEVFFREASMWARLNAPSIDFTR